MKYVTSILLYFIIHFEYTLGAYDQDCNPGTNCLNGAKCDATKTCEDCAPEYFGDYCEKRRALLKDAPTVSSECTQNPNITFNAYRFGYDTGANITVGRYVLYKSSDGSTPTKQPNPITAVTNQTTYSFTIMLTPGNQTFGVRPDFLLPRTSGSEELYDEGSLTGFSMSVPLSWPCYNTIFTNYNVTRIGDKQLSVMWMLPSSSQGSVKINITSTGFTTCPSTPEAPITNTVPSSQNSYTFSGEANKNYIINLTLVDTTGKYMDSIQIPGTTNYQTPQPAITNLLSSSVTQTSATLSWTNLDCSDFGGPSFIYSVTVVPSAGGSSTGVLSTNPVTTSPVTVSGLLASTGYNVTVQPANVVGMGISTTITFTTSTLPTTTPTTSPTSTLSSLQSTTSPSIDMALTLASVTDITASFTWTNGPQGTTSYLVKLNGADLRTISGTNTEISDLTTNTRYTVQICAKSSSGTSLSCSNSVVFTTNWFQVDLPSTTATSATLAWNVNPGSKTILSYFLTIARSQNLSPSTAPFTQITKTIDKSKTNDATSGLLPAGLYSATLRTDFTDSTSHTLATTFYTRPGPFTTDTLPLVKELVDKTTTSSVTVVLTPSSSYTTGTISSYYVAIDKLTPAQRRKRNAVTGAQLGLPASSSVVGGLSSLFVNGTVFTVGSGPNTASSTNLYANPPLASGTNYTVYLVPEAISGSFAQRGYATIVVATDGGPATTAVPVTEGFPGWGIAIIVILLLLLLLLLILLLVYFLVIRPRKNRNNKYLKQPLTSGKGNLQMDAVMPSCYKYWSDIEDLRDPRFVILDLEYGPRDLNVETIRNNSSAMRVSFEKEFLSLPNGLLHPHSTGSKTENAPKNRNPLLIPYDHSRVIIRRENPNRSDYINASYVDGYIRRRAYIAAQSPFDKTTMADFWHMIYQQNVAQIIMLTESMEEGTLKCSQYWPNFDPSNPKRSREQYSSSISVLTVAQKEYAYFTVRHLVLTFTSESASKHQQVTQYHFHGWPEHGVPTSTIPLLDLYTLVKMKLLIKDGPMLVHCGTGTTRTPIFIALDSLLQQAVHEDVVNVFRFCTKMRKARANMIRTARQYMFLYDLLFEGLLATNNTVNLDVRHTYNHLCSKNPKTKHTFLWEQHCVLEKYTGNLAETSCRVGRASSHAAHNRVFSIIPPDNHRVRLLDIPSSDYINAVWIDGVAVRDDMILTQTPMPATLTHFWTMLDQEKVTCVVDMEMNGYGVDNAVSYFPDIDNPVLRVAGLSVECISVDQLCEGKVVVRRLEVTKNVHTGQRHEIKIFHFNVNWGKYDKIPENRMAMIDLVRLVLSERLSGPLVVHCTDGANRSGLYAACHVACHKITTDNFVDVFHTVKAMKARRPQICAHLDQYKFVYKVLWDWVRTQLTKQLEVALSTNTLQGHLPPSDLECIYSHEKSSVVHAHCLTSLADLELPTVHFHDQNGKSSGDHKHTNGSVNKPRAATIGTDNGAGPGSIHYHYVDDVLRDTL